MEQSSSRSTIDANPVATATLQTIRLVDGEPIILPPEILGIILGLVRDRNSLVVCRMVNRTWNDFASSILRSDFEIVIQFKKTLRFSPHTDVKVVPWHLDQLSSLNALLTSSPSTFLNFPCRHFLFQGVQIDENEQFHEFLCNYGDQISKLTFEECEITHLFTSVRDTEEKGRGYYQALVYWVMQKVPNLTHLHWTENICVSNELPKKDQMVKDLEKFFFQNMVEFHFRPDDPYGFKEFEISPSSTNINIINDIFVNEVLAHCPNLKKFFSSPSINKVGSLNRLMEGNNLSKLKNIALNPQSRFNCGDAVRFIEKFVHEELPNKLVLEELDIDITSLPFKSNLLVNISYLEQQEQRKRSWTYVTLTNQLLENNKDTLKYLIVSTYDDEEDHAFLEPMCEKIQFPQLMPNVYTFELGISMDTTTKTVSSWEDFYNAIFFPAGHIQTLNWAHIFPCLQKFICWNFKVYGALGFNKKNPPKFNDERDGDLNDAPPFDYKIPSVTCLKICQSSSETIEYFGKVCPNVQHFTFWISCRVRQRLIWDSGCPLFFRDVFQQALEYFPVLTKLDIELVFEVWDSKNMREFFVQEFQDDIVAFLKQNAAVDDQLCSAEQGHTVLDLKGLSCFTFTITTKYLNFTKQTFTIQDRHGNSCRVVVVAQ